MNQSSPTFVPVTFAELPGWRQDDHAAAMAAFLKSCPQLIAANRAGNKGGATPTPPELLMACSEAMRLAPQGITAALGIAFFEGYFTPHRVVHSAAPGLLTGYYEPVIDGSRTPTAKYPTAIHRRPPDLVNLVDETMRGAKSSALTHGRKTESGVVAYATRAEIEQGALKGRGLEMFYLASPVDKFFMQVQGSGRIRFSDGSMVRVTYDGKNGHPYTSIGRHLIDSGKVAADKMSLEALSNWLKADAARGREIMALNKSYVFFRELKGEEANSAIGVLHIPLSTGRSLAVDAGYHTIGTPIYVSSPTLKHTSWAGGFNRLMIAQDVGSAIKGPERGDIYFGAGDSAARLAGNTKHPGNLFVLLPRGAGMPIAKAPETVPKTSDITTGTIQFQRNEP